MPTADAFRPILSQFAGDPDFEELIAYFVGELPQRIEALHHAVASGDHDTLQRLAHQLKGAAGGYGFDIISEHAAALEEAVRRSRDVEEFRPALDGLVDVCARARVDVGC